MGYTRRMRALRAWILALFLALLCAVPSFCQERPQDLSETDQAAQTIDEPKGLLGLPALRSHRPLMLTLAGGGIAGGITLTVYGIYGLSQDVQKGFSASPVHYDLLFVAGGLLFSSFFSFCFDAILNGPKTP